METRLRVGFEGEKLFWSRTRGYASQGTNVDEGEKTEG